MGADKGSGVRGPEEPRDVKKRETHRDRERQTEERQTQKVIKQTSFQADA